MSYTTYSLTYTTCNLYHIYHKEELHIGEVWNFLGVYMAWYALFYHEYGVVMEKERYMSMAQHDVGAN